MHCGFRMDKLICHNRLTQRLAYVDGVLYLEIPVNVCRWLEKIRNGSKKYRTAHVHMQAELANLKTQVQK